MDGQRLIRRDPGGPRGGCPGPQRRRSPGGRYGAVGMSDVPTLYGWAGGEAAIRRLIDAFYDRVERDDLLSVLFPGGVSEPANEPLPVVDFRRRYCEP